MKINYSRLAKRELIDLIAGLERKNKRLENFKNKYKEAAKKTKPQKRPANNKKLVESEKNYRALIDSSLDAIFVFQDGKLILINPAWEKLFGYSSAEILRKKFNPLKVIDPEFIGLYEKKILSVKKNAVSKQKFNIQGRTREANKIELEAVVNEILWNGKKAIQGIFHDITERKKIENALTREAFIFDNLYDAIIIIDLNGIIMNWNSAATRMFGYSKESILNKSISMLNNADELFVENVSNSVELEGRWTGEINFKSYNSGLVIAETIIFPFLDAYGEKIALVCVCKDITQKKESDEKLRESEEMFRKIAENSLVGIYIIQDGVFRYTNSRLAEISGYSREELIGRLGPYDITAPESSNLVKDNILKRISGEMESVHYEFKINTKKNNIIDVEAFGSTIMYKGSTAIAGMLLDITERKQYEKTLRESREKYRELADFLPQTVFEMDLEGNLLFVNHASFNAFRYTQEDFQKGVNIFQMILPGERRRAMENIHKSVTKKETNENEYIALRKDGSTFPCLVFNSLIMQDNKPIGFRGILIDITDRKVIESELRKLSRAVEQSPNSIMITNIFGDLEYVNPQFTELTGYTYDEVIGKNPRFLKSGEMLEGDYRNLWNVLLKNETWRGEFHNKKKNGELYWESVSISPIVDAHGKITHFIAIKEDITGKKIIEEELIKAKEKAEESDRLKSEFLAQMSHEIRSPINIILSYNSFIKEELEGKVEQFLEASFNSIDSAGKRLLRTLDLILNTAAVQSGYTDLQLCLVDLNTIITGLVKEFEYPANNKNLDLFYSISTNHTKIMADDYLVGEIFQNLIGNAIKYTDEGKVEIKIYELGSKLYVDIEDTGIGIAEEFIPKLFLPFTQEETGYSRKFEGNGLGLALVKKYAELIEADIEVKSVKGKGSLFTVAFNKLTE